MAAEAAEVAKWRVQVEALENPSNAEKRACHYQGEMLWLRIKDKLSEEEAAPLLGAIDDIEQKYLSLTPAQLTKTPIRRGLQRLDMLLRIVTCAVYLCLLGMITFVPMVFVVPVLDQLLLSVGWPKRYLIYEFGRKMSAHAFLLLAGVFFRVEGRLPEYATPLVLLFQHGSNLDGFLILKSFPQFFKSIGKDDIFLMPYVGWMAYVYGILPIDRKHRNTAFKQLARATRNCKSGVPLALSPEGTRSKTGQLMRFKKGPFYVQAAAKADVVPLVILGNYELWPPNRLFTCTGQVIMRYLPVVKKDAVAEGPTSKETWSRSVRKQMFSAIEDISSRPAEYEPAAPLTLWQRSLNLGAIALFWTGTAFLQQAVEALRLLLGATKTQLWTAFLGYSVSVTFALYVWYCKTQVEEEE